MDIVTFYGRFTDELAADNGVHNLRASYQAALELDGVAFPDTELQRQMRQWDAYAAHARGTVELNDDGTQVDMTDFDKEAVGARFKTDRLALANADRLTLLTSLGLLSKAGSLAVAREVEKGSGYADSLDYLNTSFKHFVQIGLSVEEWAAPWQELVANGFEGEPLEFPLEADGVLYANTTWTLEPFDSLRRDKFHKFFGLYFNTYAALESEHIPGATEEHSKLVASMGPFYRQSPEGTDDLLQRAIDIGRLPADVLWHDRLHAAVERVAPQALRD